MLAKSTFTGLLALSLSAGLLAGCSEELASPDGAAPGTVGEVSSPGILPAYQTEAEKRLSAKDDSYDDYRLAHPEWYAITEPPAKTYRHMTEWEPMDMLLVTYADSVVADKPVRQTIVDIAAATLLQANTTVGVIYESTSAKNDFINGLKAAGVTTNQINTMVQFIQIENDTIWHIDYGPLFLVDNAASTLAIADFRYYHPRVLDDAIPTRLGEGVLGVTTYRMPFSIEGGTFQGDGKGTCFTAERAIQYSGTTKAELEKVWGDYAACDQVVIMKDITDDGTGHIDMFFKLASPTQAIVGEYKAPYVSDAVNAQRMNDNQALLESIVLAGGAKLTVTRLPFPSKSGGIPRTYLNSTFVNGVNLWPIYSNDKAAEAEALAKWKQVMPSYKHVGILCDKIAAYSGTVHCVTRTVPKVTKSKWVADGSCAAGTCQGGAAGYSGPCLGAGGNECWGPAWVCACADCDGGACAEPPPATCVGHCGGESPAGCYCDTLCSQYNDCCPDYDEACGACTPSCSGKQCGDDGCGGSCGTCAAGTSCVAGQCTAGGGCGGVTFEGCCDSGGTVLNYCENDVLQTLNCGANGCGWNAANNFYDCGQSGADPSGQNPYACGACTPSCAGKVCGDDGCGGTCGTCAAGSTCQAGACVAGTDCGDVTFEGCCGDNGTTLKYCDAGSLVSGSCGNTGCGWDAANSFYNCGETGSDPSGQNPYSCDACAPDCAGKSCGDDGCGGSCGTCAAGKQCNGSGQCVSVCVPSCAGKLCGDNGCGGTCGTCGPGTQCNASGQCISTCVPSCAGKSCGDDGCGGSCGACGAGDFCKAGQCVSSCTPDCTGKQCGDDGCGGSCGACVAGTSCAGGQCICIAQCQGKGCGSDGCGGSCGTCGAGETCKSGQCECVPQCTGKSCGGDGCGGSCGTCADGTLCSGGQCECIPSCGGKACGGDGCGGSCGGCGANESCQSGTCVAGCTPQCSGKSCGSDGCGGTCGECAPTETCSGGQCDCVPQCAGKACGPDGCGGSCGSCGASETCAGTQCVTECTPDCEGKTCGDDGCGGTCGACEGNDVCAGAGFCVCLPKCSGKECGDDGCGGHCGTCPAGESCEADLCVEGCAPDCTGKSCGDDGCGGTCGSCGAGESCEAGECQGGCVPDCGGAECGDDGCNGSCGSCGAGETCDGGQCVESCAPACAGAECGDDGCGGSCGACGDGELCVDGTCKGDEPCTCPGGGSPVCGTDGVTYPSSCDADCAGVTVASEGACEVGGDAGGGSTGGTGNDAGSTGSGTNPDGVSDPGGTTPVTPVLGSKSGGCSTGGEGPGPGAALLLAALAIVAVRRRRVTPGAPGAGPGSRPRAPLLTPVYPRLRFGQDRP